MKRHARSAHVPETLRNEHEDQLRRAWAPPPGWRRLSAVNNSIVGVWYTGVAFMFLIFGGVLALLMRAQLAVPENGLLTAEQYNQVFTMHGTVMMFLFAVPIFEAVAIFLLPPMLGARELPFPRLGAFGFWSFFLGGIFVCGSIFFNAAPSSGWSCVAHSAAFSSARRRCAARFSLASCTCLSLRKRFSTRSRLRKIVVW